LFRRLFGKKRPRVVGGGVPVPVDTAEAVNASDIGVSGVSVNIRKFKPELLLIGLGNPGSKYDGTRHNAGFEVADEFCARLAGNVTAPEEYCEAVCRAAFCGSSRKAVLVAKPLTYMNLSGDAVGALVRKYGLGADRCLIIVDDFQLPLGKLRFRKDGSPGGHNGLKSVSSAIGAGYLRLRVGIGPLPPGASVIDFVLGVFDEGERGEVGRAVKEAAEAAAFMVDNGIDAAMNKYN
jgi:PTH1 family peptidyl-tRNA hydrolase